MHHLTLGAFYAQAEHFDSLVSQTPQIDRFCSSTAWVLSAYEAFSPDYETWIMHGDHGYVALVQSYHERLGQFRQPFEASWCLASPFIGPEPRALVQEFVRESLIGNRQWDLLFLSGIQRDGLVYQNLVECFSGMFFVGVGPPVVRYVASLDGQMDGFLSRRSTKFRANLRRLDRRANEQRLHATYLSSADGPLPWESLYQRILAIESTSWKGQSGTGIIDEPMQVFYQKMLPRLNETGRLRILFISDEGHDVAFVFGGVFDDTYRGLQLSFDDNYKHLSPGNLAQLWMIRELVEEGIARYDLGSELDYKRNWAEIQHETISLVVRSW